MSTAPPPAFLKAVVPALLAILAGAVVQQLQTDWGWAAILLVGAILLPLAIWWGVREPRAQRPLSRYGFPALAIAYVLLTATFSVFGDQLGWLWRVSISAPIGTAAIAVLLLSRGRQSVSMSFIGVTLIGFGVALIGLVVAAIVDIGWGLGVAGIGVAVAIIAAGVAILLNSRLAGGGVLIGTGVIAIGLGAFVDIGWGRGGVAIVLGVAAIAAGLATILDNSRAGGVAVIGFGVAGIGLGVTFIETARPLGLP